MKPIYVFKRRERERKLSLTKLAEKKNMNKTSLNEIDFGKLTSENVEEQLERLRIFDEAFNWEEDFRVISNFSLSFVLCLILKLNFEIFCVG